MGGGDEIVIVADPVPIRSFIIAINLAAFPMISNRVSPGLNWLDRHKCLAQSKLQGTSGTARKENYPTPATKMRFHS